MATNIAADMRGSYALADGRERRERH